MFGNLSRVYLLNGEKSNPFSVFTLYYRWTLHTCPVLCCGAVQSLLGHQGGFMTVWRWGSLLLVLCSCFFLSKIEERLTASSGDLSMSVDEDEDSVDRREVDELQEDARSMLRSCRFTMRMKMVDSAWKQVRSLLRPWWLLGSFLSSFLKFPLNCEPSE